MTGHQPTLRWPDGFSASGNSLALAVSGGSDSMALLHLILLAQRDLKSCIAPCVLTVDHGLRPGSAAEAAQVAAWCRALDLEHVTLRWLGARPGSGLQAAARRARYDLMSDFCAARGIDALVTAHTADDQAETVAMRLARTDSPKSIAGIWPRMNWNGIPVLRPLLHARRVDLRDCLRDLGQPWIDDPSNEDLRFERVRVRKAMPREEVPRLSARAELARAAVMDLALKADVAFAHHLGRNALGYFSLGRNEARLMLADLLCEVLLRMLALTGGGARPLRAQLRALVGDLRGPEPFRRTLAGSLIAARKDDVILCREAGRISPEQVMPEEGRMLWDNRFHLTAPAGAVIRPIGQRNATRHHEAPAYVVAALPSVEIPGQIPFFPHFTPVSGCAVTPNERFLP